jgi:hypothetical protein
MVAEAPRGESHGETHVLSEEARIGKRVRVREGARLRSTLSTLVGTIEKRWGDPTYTALDVLLDDGSRQLFWHHELEEVDARGVGGA